MRILSTLLIALLPLSHVWAINCHGSPICRYWPHAPWQPIPTYLNIALEAVSPYGKTWLPLGNDTIYHRGEHIICRSGEWGDDNGPLCVFLDGDGVPEEGVPMRVVIYHLAKLVDYGCRVCGSSPLKSYVELGKDARLVVDYVPSTKCCGVRNQPLNDRCLAIMANGRPGDPMDNMVLRELYLKLCYR